MPSEREYTFHLTVQDIQVLNMGLMEVRYKDAAPVVAKLNEQIRQQEKEQPDGSGTQRS